jgi:formate/nitrite transporter FocA (FNT family)
MSDEDLGEGTLLPDRYTSEDTFERIIKVADEEVSKGIRELFFSGLAAGIAITITFLLYASMTGKTANPVLGALLYPLGFIYIILGNYQLFTENTLPPVTLVLERMASIPSMLTVWGTVLAANLAGGGIGAIFLATTDVLSNGAKQAAITIAQSAFSYSFQALFFKGVFAGAIVAGLVWLDFSSRDTISRFFVAYLAFLSIPLGGLYHVVVTTTEVVYLAVLGEVALLTGLTQVALPVLLGNTVGGVVFVTFVNYFQTPHYIQEDPSHRLPIKEWLFSWNAGRDRKSLLKNEDQ